MTLQRSCALDSCQWHGYRCPSRGLFKMLLRRVLLAGAKLPCLGYFELQDDLGKLLFILACHGK
uniref:Uncharacterized protein n=1 Tax=Anguilla anguilla TaxID=7936 RepID=A0A0E9PNW9_ANGAN